MNTLVKDRVRSLLDQQTHSGQHTRRKVSDLVARYGIAVGGVSVIVAVVLIFFYLLWVVLPIFQSAELERVNTSPIAGAKAPISHLSVDEYGEVGMRLEADGSLLFYSLDDGRTLEQAQLPLAPGETVVSTTEANDQGLLGVVLSSGRILLVEEKYDISYPDGERLITPGLAWPFGEAGIELMPAGEEPVSFTARVWGDGALLVAQSASGELFSKIFTIEESFLDESLELSLVGEFQTPVSLRADYLLASDGPGWLYAIGADGAVQAFRFAEGTWQLNESKRLVSRGTEISEVRFLLGHQSLLVGDSSGRVAQWFPVRGDAGFELTHIRDFQLGNAAIRNILPESRRKGFIAIGEQGQLGVFYTTSGRSLLEHQLDAPPGAVALSSRGSALSMIGAEGNSLLWYLDNQHPEISWSSLWNEVWYESYEEPGYTWQSSASTNDFEPKFSLVPLSFGTLKAAFYAMLFAVPLAIFGAIFTAYFMSPRMRNAVKPTVEIMEALPTVILGFLAGLWLAPLIEENLAGTFMIFLFLPLAVILFGFLWSQLPKTFLQRIPDGWQAAILIPVIIAFVWLAMSLSSPVENTFFGGNMPAWVSQSMGLNFDQRNSIVVGIAMGFAVIPTIFSITEDAIFSVPRHLTNGSLALGASPWQTLTRVVLPTASPGIFSALMIGLGRAVGETMIVLMATGNTPIMDMNIFEGMRTLSANIAVEMPESAVGSSHYRVLFLAAFVLFLFTFVVNTVAEVIRQRLRGKYGSL